MRSLSDRHVLRMSVTTVMRLAQRARELAAAAAYAALYLPLLLWAVSRVAVLAALLSTDPLPRESVSTEADWMSGHATRAARRD